MQIDDRITKIQDELKQIVASKTIDDVALILECYDIREKDDLLRCYDEGFWLYPVVDYFSQQFSLNSVVVNSFEDFGSGQQFGYRYYKDIESAYIVEICNSFNTLFFACGYSEKHLLSPELLPLIKKQSQRLIHIIESLNSQSQLKEHLTQLSTTLEGLGGRIFKEFTTIQEFIISWETKGLSSSFETVNPTKDYEMTFGKPFNQIDLTQTPELTWALLKFPTSEV